MSTDTISSPGSAEGQTTTGRFELVREIGRGGFGIVYEAIDLHRNQRVALKVLRRDRPSRLSALKGEFRALRGITHPNLVLLFDLVAEGEDWSFTMELVDGLGFLEYVWPGWELEPVTASDLARGSMTTLDRRTGTSEQEDRSASKAALTVDRIRLRLAMRQLALGVDALHRARKLHRDIKPSNIRITPEGRLVLLDYGLVADVEADGRAEVGPSIAGTMGYMAPEQAWGQRVTEASDWYSVGAVLYEALTGAKPGLASQADLEEWARARQAEGGEPDTGPPGELEALCCRLLQQDPAARPRADEVLTIFGGRRPSGAPGSAHGAPGFVGRRVELEALTGALDLATSGKSVCARVHGASGLGKTVLCAHFLEQAKAKDPTLVVLKGRCYEREEVPYKALDALVDGLASHLIASGDLETAVLLPRDFSALARLFRVLDEVPRPPAPRQLALSTFEAQDLRRLAFGALRELIGRLVDRRPLILWIDDAQWGDEDSAALLIEMLRPPRSPSLLLLVSHRDGEPGRFLSGLDEWLNDPHSDTELVDVRLGRLPPEEARELGRALLPGAFDDESVGRLCDEADGSPLFMQQLAAGPHPAHTSDTSGPTLVSVLRAALRTLPEEARSLMEIVAVSGGPISTSTALLASGSPRDGLAIITRLVGQRLLTDASGTRGERIEAYHDKIREVAVAALEPERRRAVHAALTATLEAGPESERDPEALLVHCSGSGDLARAATYALVAAERAESALAFVHAAELYELALGWRRGTEVDTPTENRDLNRRRAKALANAGRGGDAALVYLHVADEAEGLEALECKRLAAEQLFASGQNDEALRVLAPVLRRVGLSFPSSGAGAVWRIAYHFMRLLLRGVKIPEQPRLQTDPLVRFRLEVGWTAAVGLSSVNPVVATALILQHLNLALTAGDRRHACLSLPSFGVLWLVAGSQGGLRRGTALLEKGEALAKQVDDPLLHGLIGIFASTRMMVVGDWPGTLTCLDGSLEALEAHSTGVRYWHTVALGMRLQTLESLGRVDELRASAAKWEDEAVVSKDLLGQLYASLFTALGLLAADDPEGARRRADGAIAGWTAQAGFSAQHLFALRIIVYADLYEGAGSVAHERILKAWSAMKASQLLRVQSTRIDILLLRARATLARASTGPPEPRLLRDVEQVARRMEKELRGDMRPSVSLLRAGVARRQGDTASAKALLEQALTGFDSSRMEVHSACVRRIKGVLLGGEEGDTMVKEADALMKARGILDPPRWIAIVAPGLAG